jgi:hypothetical protein
LEDIFSSSTGRVSHMRQMQNRAKSVPVTQLRL